MKHCLIATEGPHDQAVLSKIFRLLGYSEFNGDVNDLDEFWEIFIPKYPAENNLYRRLSFPTVVQNSTHSIAIYLGEGDKLKKNLATFFSLNPIVRRGLYAFGVVIDSDNRPQEAICSEWRTQLSGVFPNFPSYTGVSSSANPKTGLHVIPTIGSGVIDTIMCQCGPHSYPDLWTLAQTYVESAKVSHSSNWSPFDEQKALTASVVSILRPASTNTVSYKQDLWVGMNTLREVPELAKLKDFLQDLIT